MPICRFTVTSLLVGLLLLLPATVSAHEIGGSPGGGFFSGVLHPVLGFDHFLAMVSVGLLSVQIGGQAIWKIPATFVGMMLVGGVLGMAEVRLLPVELGIAFSVFALGLALAAEGQVPVLASIIFVSIFGLFHGHAHGSEMPAVASPFGYALGFVTGTASIHLLGVLLGLLSEKIPRGTLLLRGAGAAIALVGLHLLIG